MRSWQSGLLNLAISVAVAGSMSAAFGDAGWAAETFVPQRLTLREAESILITHNLPVIAAQNGVDIAQAQKLVAGINPNLPTITYGQVLSTIDDQQQSGKGQVHFPSPLWNASIGMSYVIERGGKLELRTRLAEDQIHIAEAQVLDTLRLQVGALRQAFSIALVAKDNLVVALENRASLGETERLLRERVNHGEAPQGDLIRFQAGRLQFETDLTAAKTSYELACRDVLNALGASSINIAPAASGRGAPPEMAEFALTIDGSLDGSAKPVQADVLRQALDNRADVVAARHGVEAADSQIDLTRAQRSRDITIGPSLSRTRGSGLGSVQYDSTIVGLNVSIPIFTSQLVESNVMVAIASRKQVQAQAEVVRLQAETDFEKAMRSYHYAQELLQVYSTEALQRAEEALQISRAAYERGGQSLLDVLDAQRTLSATRVAVNQARFNNASSLFQLEQATGIDDLVVER